MKIIITTQAFAPQTTPYTYEIEAVPENRLRIAIGANYAGTAADVRTYRLDLEEARNLALAIETACRASERMTARARRSVAQ